MKFKCLNLILLCICIDLISSSLLLNSTLKTFNCYDCINNYTNSVYCSSNTFKNSSYCCPNDPTKRTLSCFSIPQLDQICTDFFINDHTYNYLQYSTCQDYKNVCKGKTIEIMMTDAMIGITKRIIEQPDQKSCFWNLTYKSDLMERQILSSMHKDSPLRISINNISGVTLHVFNHEKVLLEVIEQNITDNDQPYLDMKYTDFKNGDQLFILALKDQTQNKSSFVIDFQIKVQFQPLFYWIPDEDEVYLFVSIIIIALLLALAALLYHKTQMLRMQQASKKIATRKVKAVKKRVPKKRKANVFNPYQNQPDNQFDPSSNLLDKNKLYKGDQSIRAKNSLMDQVIEDSFFSGQDDQDSQEANDENEISIINNQKLIQGHEHLKRAAKNSEQYSKRDQPPELSSRLGGALKASKFKNVKHRNNYMDNTQVEAGFNANETNMNSNKSRDIINNSSYSQGTPPFQKNPMKNIFELDKVKAFGNKKHSEAVNYKDIWQADQKQSQSQKRLQNQGQIQHKKLSQGSPRAHKSSRSVKKKIDTGLLDSNKNKNHSKSNSTRKNSVNAQSMKGSARKHQTSVNNPPKIPQKNRPAPLNLNSSAKRLDETNSQKSKSVGRKPATAQSKQSPQFETKSGKAQISDFSDNRSISGGRSSSTPQSQSRHSSNKNIVKSKSQERRNKWREGANKSKSEIFVLPLGEEIKEDNNSVSDMNQIKMQRSDSSIFKNPKGSYEDAANEKSSRQRALQQSNRLSQTEGNHPQSNSSSRRNSKRK